MLTEDMLNGKVRVMIMNTSISGEQVEEGYAYIKKVHQGDRGGVDADVAFDDDPDYTFRRWVFANHQQ